ncbi:MAG: SH3 domain-containing protein [Candidatus Beckwithbacteria bacterium]|nr:SH3 domain-containing protein [Candidatus Beckwithbacteria bacterium]
MPYLLALTFFLFATPASAANYQQCFTSSTCTIGEFLYDDQYQPITTATCSATIKYPDGGNFLTGNIATGSADAWYAYEATIGTTTGLYRTNLCCTTPTAEYLCIDKSFEVTASPSATLTSADIWNYTSRTLTGYGSLITDIWASTSRSLTGFGSLAADVWNSSSRSLTSFGDLVANIWSSSTTATTGPAQTLTVITTEQTKQRELLEKLVNAPIVSLSLEENQVIPNLNVKLKESQTQANALYDTVKSAKSRLLVLNSKWGQLSQNAITQEITSLSSLFQNYPPLTSLTAGWNAPIIALLNQSAVNFNLSLAPLLTSAAVSKPKLAPSALLNSLEYLNNLEADVGDITSVSNNTTLYGYLAQVSERNVVLETERQKLAVILENWDGQGENILSQTVNNTRDRLLALNQYPGGANLTKPTKISSNQKLNLKNIVFNLQALLGLNQQMLAQAVGTPIRSLWLEEGSIIFRAVITNPSTIISQTVPLKFYLPRELKTEDIVTLDPSLNTQYDAVEDALYVTGSYELKPEETKLVFVEVQDIWQLAPAELETIRKQAAELLRPIEKTSYFSQGTVLKSQIEVTLDKILMAQKKAITPENRIRAFREARLELNGVNANMTRLQDLVAEASGTGSIFGFVGGVQTVAVWGILLIVIASFVFLTIYMRQLSRRRPKLKITTPEITPKHSFWTSPAVIPIIIIFTSVATATITQLLLKSRAAPAQIQQLMPPEPSPELASPLASPQPSGVGGSPASPSASPKNQNINIKNEKEVLGESIPSRLTVPENSSVNIRSKPSSAAPVIMTVKTSIDVFVFSKSDDWSRIDFGPNDANQSWWVSSQFLD